MEGTSGTQRVVRHIGGTSWPGLCYNLIVVINSFFANISTLMTAIKTKACKMSGEKVLYFQCIKIKEIFKDAQTIVVLS